MVFIAMMIVSAAAAASGCILHACDDIPAAAGHRNMSVMIIMYTVILFTHYLA
jgi:hypothetical protein